MIILHASYTSILKIWFHCIPRSCVVINYSDPISLKCHLSSSLIKNMNGRWGLTWLKLMPQLHHHRPWTIFSTHTILCQLDSESLYNFCFLVDFDFCSSLWMPFNLIESWTFLGWGWGWGSKISVNIQKDNFTQMPMPMQLQCVKWIREYPAHRILIDAWIKWLTFHRRYFPVPFLVKIVFWFSYHCA